MCDTLALQILSAREPRVSTPQGVRRAVRGWADVWKDPERARKRRAAATIAELDRFDSYVPSYFSHKAQAEEAAAVAAAEAAELAKVAKERDAAQERKQAREKAAANAATARGSG